MKNRQRLSLSLWIAAMAGCGGRVVVDGFQGGTGGATGTSGQGQGGATGTSGQGQGGAAGECGVIPDPSTLTLCGGGVTGTAGGPLMCQDSFCAMNGDTFDANCTENTCLCLKNGLAQCTCSLNAPGNFCTVTPICCPWGK